MKKFILSLIAVLAVSVSSFAAVNTNIDKASVKSKMNKMENVLQMAKKQEIKNAVNKNLRNASRVLNVNQYKKYLQILNVTLQNNKIADYTK